jgi:hypothetical protein
MTALLPGEELPRTSPLCAPGRRLQGQQEGLERAFTRSAACACLTLLSTVPGRLWRIHEVK